MIAEKKFAPITLPGALSFDGAPAATQTEDAALKPPATITEEKASTIKEGVKEVVEVKPQEVAVSAPSDLNVPGANVNEVDVASSPVGESIADDEERTSWEVGDSDDDSAYSSAAETPQDVIDRMSRELADRQRTDNEPDEIADHAKSAS